MRTDPLPYREKIGDRLCGAIDVGALMSAV